MLVGQNQIREYNPDIIVKLNNIAATSFEIDFTQNASFSGLAFALTIDKGGLCDAIL